MPRVRVASRYKHITHVYNRCRAVRCDDIYIVMVEKRQRRDSEPGEALETTTTLCDIVICIVIGI